MKTNEGSTGSETEIAMRYILENLNMPAFSDKMHAQIDVGCKRHQQQLGSCSTWSYSQAKHIVFLLKVFPDFVKFDQKCFKQGFRTKVFCKKVKGQHYAVFLRAQKMNSIVFACHKLNAWYEQLESN